MSNCNLTDTNEKLSALVDDLKDEEIIACDLESSGLDIRKDHIEGIGLGTDKKQYFIPFPNKLPLEAIKTALATLFCNRPVIFHNAKYDLELLIQNAFPVPSQIHDTLIMSWLIDENSQHGLKYLAKAILDEEPKEWSQLKRTMDLFTSPTEIVKQLADYCGDDVSNTYRLYFHFLPLLKKEGIFLDYERLELKLIWVLVRMELRGIRIDAKWLKQKQQEASIKLNEYETKMKQVLNNSNINVRSPQQLETILFDTLGYAPEKVTDAGKRSTDNESLEAIMMAYTLTEEDFVPLLLKFRDLDKLYGTYFTTLVDQAGEEEIVHASFLQHGTRTGRLSSNEPNLQNIPTRSDEWNVRCAFIPRDGYKFLIADYSQIELRMLAHFSLDDKMVQTFVDDGDIHAKTMELTGTERRVAKAINFGLIYGMGPRTLAHTLTIKEKEAESYIEKFFAGYPKVRTYISRIQQSALKTGIVTMITGRRRRFQEIKDKRWYNAIERQAINTKIQGSAADLIKIAMIKLDGALKQYDSHLLVQIHDEVIVEVPMDKIEVVKGVIKDTMENALKLNVPIKVKIVEGDRWVKD